MGTNLDLSGVEVSRPDAGSTPPDAAGRKLAVLVGIDCYGNGIPRLSNAVRDVMAVADVLRSLHGYQIRSLLDQQATRDELRRLLLDLRTQMGPSDRLVFYFAGHGIVEETIGDSGTAVDIPRGFVIPQDARREDPASFLSMSEIQQELQQVPCRHVLVVLDCCFAGAFRWSATRDIEVTPRKLYRERYERYLRDPAWQILTSTAHDEKALDVVAGKSLGSRGEKSTQSPFASALCEGLRGAADMPIGRSPPDGVILASELHLYVEDHLKRLEERLGHPQQKPLLWSLSGKHKGQFTFLTPGRSLQLPAAAELNEQNNPYRGLQAYEADNKDLFFGRNQAADLLCDRVRGQSLTVVVGASGTGKSSLVGAGLVPRLGELGWHVLTTQRPGQSPLSALSAAAAELGTAGTDRLDRAVATWCQGHPDVPLLLIIDQAEELVTLGGAFEQEFLLRLNEARAEPALHVVLTLRSDFEPHFRDLMPEGGVGVRFLIPHMSRVQLRAAVEEPAHARVLYFAPPELVDRLVDEVIDTPGALPLLSFTLSEMYRTYVKEGREDRTLRAADYEALGGVSGALSQRADEIYGSLPGTHQDTLRRLMLRMVVPGELVRRRVLRAELAFENQEEQGRTEQVLARLAEARLLVTGQDNQDHAYVEPAHDKLVMGWQRLRVFIEEEKEVLPLQRSLTQAVQEWQRAGRHGSGLWSGDPRLPQLQALHRQTPERFNVPESEFIRKSGTRHTLIKASIGTVVAVVAAAAGVAVWEARQALQQEKRALIAAREVTGTLAVGQTRQVGSEESALVNGVRAAGPFLQEKQPIPPRALAGLNAAWGAMEISLVLRGHTEQVYMAEFSPDGKWVLTGSWDKTARLWEVATGREMRVLRGHSGRVMTAVFSPDGTHVLTGSLDKTARLWEVATEGDPLVLSGHGGPVVTAVFSPDGTRVLTGSSDKTARLWDAGSGREMRVLRGHSGPVVTAVFSPLDGQKVLTGSVDGTARLWEVATERDPLMLRGHGGPVGAAAFSPDGTRVLTASDDHTARLWDATTGREMHVLSGHGGIVFTAVFSPDGQQVLTGSEDSTARLWETRTGREVHELRGHSGRVAAAVFSPDGQRVLTGSEDGTARLWEADTEYNLRVLSGHDGVVGTAVFSADGQRMLTGSADGTARLWAAGPGHEMRELRGFNAKVTTAVFSPDGNRVLTASDDQTVRLWEASTGRALRGLGGKVTMAALSSDGQQVVTGNEDGTARLWASDTEHERVLLRGHDKKMTAAAFSPDGQWVLTGSDDGTARLWETSTGHERAALRGHQQSVTTVAFSSDGQRALTGSDDGTARLWETGTGHERAVLRGHQKSVTMVAFSPDGQQAVTGSVDGTARLWDAATGHDLRVLRGHTGLVVTVMFSPDGKRVLTGSWDATARLWDADTGREQYVLRGHDGVVRTAVFSPDGQRVLTSGENSARLWDAGTGREILALGGEENARISYKGAVGGAKGWGSRVDFSPDRTRLVAILGDRRVVVTEITDRAFFSRACTYLMVRPQPPESDVPHDEFEAARHLCTGFVP